MKKFQPYVLGNKYGTQLHNILSSRINICKTILTEGSSERNIDRFVLTNDDRVAGSEDSKIDSLVAEHENKSL